MSHHHSPVRKNEDEYFARESAELIQQLRARLDAERERRDRESHLMRCPRCGGQLEERAFRQVKIDVCPDCRGVWLDAGELELIEQLRDESGSRDIVGRYLADAFAFKAP